MALHSENSLNIVSLCTGGGGLDLGVELAIPCARPVVLVEREAFAVARLVSAMEEGLMAPAPVWSDVRTFNGRPWRGLVDGLIGGIPCQPHSVAGKRLGADDERDLWSDTRRIIVQSGAWFVLIENVQGMLSTGGFERVWRDLRRLGFAVEAGLFTAAEVGAPHKRERLFILGVADSDEPVFCRQPSAGELAVVQCDDGYGRENFAMVHAIGGGHNGIAPDALGQPIGRTVAERTERSSLPIFPPGPADLDAWRDIIERAPHLEPAVRRVADELAGRVDQLRMLGNGVNPLQAAYAVRTLATRLARRSAAAVRIVRMMDLAEQKSSGRLLDGEEHNEIPGDEP